MPDEGIIELERKIEQKINVPQKSTGKKVPAFDLDKAKRLATSLNRIEAGARAATI